MPTGNARTRRPASRQGISVAVGWPIQNYSYPAPSARHRADRSEDFALFAVWLAKTCWKDSVSAGNSLEVMRKGQQNKERRKGPVPSFAEFVSASRLSRSWLAVFVTRVC